MLPARPRAYGPPVMERRFRRDLGSLGAIFEFVREFLADLGIDASQAFDLDLILEELFTNLLRHAKGGSGQISIALARSGSTVTLTLRDFDVEAFDVSRARPVDVRAPLEQRTPGGLGLFLIQKLADEIRYDYRDRVSTVTVTKTLEG